MAFVDGHREPSIDFDYDALDPEEPETASPKKESDAVTLGKLFGLLLTYGGTDPKQFFITANVLAFVLGLHPNQGQSGEAIAAGLKMEKAAWFRRVNQMRKHLEQRGAVLPRIAGEWSKPARKAIQQKTIEQHEAKATSGNARKAKQAIDRICAAYQKTRGAD